MKRIPSDGCFNTEEQIKGWLEGSKRTCQVTPPPSTRLAAWSHIIRCCQLSRIWYYTHAFGLSRETSYGKSVIPLRTWKLYWKLWATLQMLQTICKVTEVLYTCKWACRLVPNWKSHASQFTKVGSPVLCKWAEGVHMWRFTTVSPLEIICMGDSCQSSECLV